MKKASRDKACELYTFKDTDYTSISSTDKYLFKLTENDTSISSAD